MDLARTWQDWWGRVARDPTTLLLLAAAAIQVPLGFSSDLVIRTGWAVAAVAVFVAACLTVVVGRVAHRPAWVMAAPYLLLVVAFCWRAADKEPGNGLGGLIVVAIVWLGFFGTRRQLWIGIVAGFLAELLPAWLVAGDVDADDWGRAALTAGLCILVGPTIQSLVQRGATASVRAREQQEIYQLLVEHLPLTTVMLLDENLCCVTIGGHWLAKTGIDGAQFRGRRVEDFFDEPDRAQAQALYEQARTVETIVQMDLAGGRCYEFHALPLTGPDGVKFVLSLARDISEQRVAERERQDMLAALTVSEESFREAFEGAPIGMALTTADDQPERFLRVNAAFAAILGRAPDDLVGMVVADVTHPEDVALQPDLSVRATSNTKLRKRFLRPSGRAVWVEVSYTVVRDRDSRPTHIIKQIQDIQTIKESERALLDALEQQRAATARLRELDRIRTELVATVSHELRTPLTSVHGYLELLGGEPLSPTQVSMLEVARRNTDRLSDLVDNLLVLVRLDADDYAPAVPTSDVDIRAALSAAADTVRPEITERNQKLTVTTPDEPAVVRGDSDQIDRVLVNLLSNASKYTPRGGSIDAAVTTRGTTVQIAVSDTGIGIPHDEQQQLFRRFFRASTARDHSISGNGLGLAIVKSIVERHAGEVSVVSEPGDGSTFTVTFPAVTRETSLIA